jgi:hypothetical protein
MLSLFNGTTRGNYSTFPLNISHIGERRNKFVLSSILPGLCKWRLYTQFIIIKYSLAIRVYCNFIPSSCIRNFLDIFEITTILPRVVLNKFWFIRQRWPFKVCFWMNFNWTKVLKPTAPEDLQLPRLMAAVSYHVVVINKISEALIMYH